MNTDTNILRIRVLSSFFILVALLIGIKLYSVQIVNGATFSSQADRQYARPSSDVFDRGTIFFTDKDGEKFSAATLKTGYTVALNPSSIEDFDGIYNRLSTVLEIEEDVFFEKIVKRDDPWEVLAERVDKETADKIIELKLPGVSVHKEKWRYYPGTTLASHVLGFVGFNNDLYGGRYGIEKHYNDVLSRGDTELYVNFFAEVFSDISDTIIRKDYSKEGDVVLTIEPTVQLELEKQLRAVTEEWGSQKSMGIVMDPKTGEIIAMAVTPSFDPNTFNEVDNVDIFANPLVERVYEMGSIIKPLTVAAGLDSGAITPETTYYDGGSLTLDGATISNYDGKGRGTVPMQEVLNQSLNTGVTFIMNEMGTEAFRDYMYGFGLAEETGVDLPGETNSLVANLESPRKIEYATASFGQGIALSPIMTVRALSALGNGGYLVTPHVVKEIEYKRGGKKEISHIGEEQQVLSAETSETITRMLVEVVDDALLEGEVKIDTHTVAAKTGTAQIASPRGGYYDDRYLHSFFGYFPAYDPEFLVFLMTIEPHGVRYASQTLTYPFHDLTKFLINYYEIPPDR